MELDGGYECDCFSDGHELADDGVTCEGIWLLLPLCGVCDSDVCVCVCTHTWRKSE